MPVPKGSSAKHVTVLPAVLLVCVACVQIFLAKEKNLSPWKGGGFGMFAVADAPGTRFITFEAVDQEGQAFTLEAAGYLPKNKERFLNSFPKQSDLRDLADALMKERFVPVGNRFSNAFEAFRKQNPSAELPDLLTEGLSPAPVYRIRREDDVPETLQKAKSLAALKITLWKIVATGKGTKIQAHALLKPEIRGRFP